MKKVLTLAVVLAMLVSMFTMGVSAVDNYEPKTINLIANTDGTVSLPEGYVVYIGDTLVFPRGEMIFMGDFEVRYSEPTEIREMAFGIANDIMVEIDGVRVGQSWTDAIPLKNSTVKDSSNYWFEPGTNLEVAGKFEFFVFSAVPADWSEQYLLKPEPKVLSIDVIDPTKVDTIVTPPAVDTPVVEEPVESTEEPVESTEEPVESTEEPVESTEEPVESTEEPVESTEEPTESTDEPTDVAPADNGWVIWVIVGAAVVAAVVVIVLVSKKKK